MKWFPPLEKLFPLNLKENKTKLILILFLVGIFLLLLPSPNKKEVSLGSDVNMINQAEETKKELEKTLSELSGVKVKIIFTHADTGNLTVVTEDSITSETNEKDASSTLQKNTKPLTDSNKNIIVKNRLQPTVKGVCVFYFGPYDKETETLLYRAAKSALGAEIHTVEVIFKP